MIAHEPSETRLGDSNAVGAAGGSLPGGYGLDVHTAEPHAGQRSEVRIMGLTIPMILTSDLCPTQGKGQR